MMPTSSPPSQTIQLRLYYDFERPRNGRQILVTLPPNPSPTTLIPSQILSHLPPDPSHTPHIYSPSADCFIPLIESTPIHLPPCRTPYAPNRLDIKLIPITTGNPQTSSPRPNLASQLLCDSATTSLTASWFAIGILRGKTASNHGTLWRSALQFGAALTFTIGQRYNRKVEGSADIFKTHRQIPCLSYESVPAFMATRPVDAQIVVVEYGGEDLVQFEHPKRAVYVLGSEDCGIPPALVVKAQRHVSIPTVEGRPSSLNVAAAGTIIMYDRLLKEKGMGSQRTETATKER